MKVLVTGFEPFGRFTVNSSQQAVALLPKGLGGAEIITAVLPVSYSRSDKILFDLIREHRPDAVVCVGQNASAPEIRVETTAGNYAHSEEEDADHNLWLYRSIDMSGAPSYRSTLPVENMVRNLKKAGIAAEISHSAGTFVCNCLMYQALRACENEFQGMPCGFIHVPAVPEQCSDAAAQPCMALDVIVQGLRIAIATVIDPESDGILPETQMTENSEPAEVEVPAPADVTAAAGEPEAEEPTAWNERDDEDDFRMAANVTPEMLAALNDDDDEDAGAEAAEPETAVTAEAGTVPAEEAEEKAPSAAEAAVAYFAKQRKVRGEAPKPLDDGDVYYGTPKKSAPVDESKNEAVLKRISASVPEKITTMTDAPKETLFDPARERANVDLKDYRVFNVKDKYRVSGMPQEQMTLTEFMDEFIPEREKTDLELREERARTLIHEGDVRDPRTFPERQALREAARRKEDAKEHVVFGDLFFMSDTMRAMGKTWNKSVLVDDDIHVLLYTAVEDGGDICGYKISELDAHGRVTKREIGELPLYAMAYEKYYLFRALTEGKKIVCDPETYELRLEDGVTA